MVVIAVVVGLVVLVLVCGYLLDRKARHRGNSLHDPNHIQRSIQQTRSEVRASRQIMQLRPFRQPKE